MPVLPLSHVLQRRIFYNSWPLGYIVNNQTARHGLASDLERVGQPYYWIFVLGDILTGFCLIGACYLIGLRLRPAIHTRAWVVVYGGILLFGLGTAIAALVPAHCSVAVSLQCGPSSSSGLGLDAFFSGIGALGLFASLVSICLLSVLSRVNIILIRITWLSLLAWSLSGILFAVFALLSGTAAQAQLLQQIFLIFCGLAFIVIGCNVNEVFSNQLLE